VLDKASAGFPLSAGDFEKVLICCQELVMGCGRSVSLNATDLIAAHEAEHFFEVPTDALQILSVGTTIRILVA